METFAGNAEVPILGYSEFKSPHIRNEVSAKPLKMSFICKQMTLIFQQIKYIYQLYTMVEIPVGHWTLSDQNAVNVLLILQYVRT